MPDETTSLDDLVARLRDRAADPRRRADVIVDSFSASVRSLDLGALLASTADAAAHLRRAVGEIRETGTTSAATQRAAQGISALMGRPAQPELAAPATQAALVDAEAALGHALPTAIRRAYGEVADGGFGPGVGLVTIACAVGRYREFRHATPGPRGSAWPAGLLPVVDHGGGWDCVDVAVDSVIAWDPEGLRERSNEAAWQRTFDELAPSTEAWLRAWVAAPTQQERMAELMADAQVVEARKARARIAEMTPAERANMGLPEVGWERVVWGGIGLEEDE